MYINSYGENYTGGETVLPNSPEGKHQKDWADVSRCTSRKLAVRPMTGDALLFWNTNPAGKENEGSLHGSCDVLTGKKYSATIWIRQAPFHLEFLAPEPADGFECVDTSDNCSDWAQSGECEKNPNFMDDKCKKSCNAC